MLLGLAIIHYCPIRFLEPMKKFVEEKLHPLFRGSSTFELLLLSLMAGFGEELLFRWCLQGGLTSVLVPFAGAPTATLIGLLIASVAFGMCHWINSSYAVTTFVIGLFLGLTMIWSGSFLVPAIAHALYDFIALIYIVRLGNNKSSG
jgi:membrane protease YdiL (CAAX protease family)